MQDIRMEDWFWKCQGEDEKQEAAKNAEVRQSRKDTRWMNWVRRILLVEVVVILLNVMYEIGGTIVRGYSSFGGESLLVLALIGAGLYRMRDVLK